MTSKPIDLIADLLNLCDYTVDPTMFVRRVWFTGNNVLKIEVLEDNNLRTFQLRVTEVT